MLVDEGEDRLGVDRHLRLGAGEVVTGEELVVVDDDPVVDARHVAVPDRMVVGRNGRVTLGVVPHVQEHLGGSGRHGNELEQCAGACLLLVHLEAIGRAVGVPDGVGAPFGNPGQQCLRSEGAAQLRA